MTDHMGTEIGGWTWRLHNTRPVPGEPALGAWTYFCVGPKGTTTHQPSKLWRHVADAKRSAIRYCREKGAS